MQSMNHLNPSVFFHLNVRQDITFYDLSAKHKPVLQTSSLVSERSNIISVMIQLVDKDVCPESEISLSRI